MKPEQVVGVGLVLVGLAFVVYAAALIWPPLSLLVIGVPLLMFGAAVVKGSLQ